MSVQFGSWNFDGKPVDRDHFEEVKALLAPYAPDGSGTYFEANIGIVYHALHTTKEAWRETQPVVMPSGSVLTWDGRLDNRTEIIHKLKSVVTNASTDAEIVAAAYEHWANRCFRLLIGDWALSIWDPQMRSLTLAKDPIGARHLYYSFNENRVSWSTILDPLVLYAGKAFSLCEEYVAGWLSLFPAAHLTPYAEIHSVPPSSSVLVSHGKHTITKYWDFDPDSRIHYRTDAEYEEHFRAVFAEAVRRRLRADKPILAELSGGMDSSSIVCMADTIIARGAAETPRLDTISYYDDSDPNINEYPYFTKVEEKRGRVGCHIDVARVQQFRSDFNGDEFAITPSSGGSSRSEAQEQFIGCLTSQGSRVVLSGTGGDEVTGGVPTPTSELEDLIVTAQFGRLAHQLKIWALNKRKPWFHLFFEAARPLFPTWLVGTPKYKKPAPWLTQGFVNRNRKALLGYEDRLRVFGPLPSFQENVFALDTLRRQFACEMPHSEPPYEKRYPFLDRDLLEFMFAIPREQVVRPGQRRSLMRRALVGIVPDDVLNRRRKAYAARTPTAAVSTNWASLSEMNQHMLSDSLGIVNSSAFLEVLQNARMGKEVPLVTMLRTLTMEYWLRGLRERHVLHSGALSNAAGPPLGMGRNFVTETHSKSNFS